MIGHNEHSITVSTFILVYNITFCSVISEIYKMVSQKQIHDDPDDANKPSNDVEHITLRPTDNAPTEPKSCCSIWDMINEWNYEQI
jgi:hypothetical protein